MILIGVLSLFLAVGAIAGGAFTALLALIPGRLLAGVSLLAARLLCTLPPPLLFLALMLHARGVAASSVSAPDAGALSAVGFAAMTVGAATVSYPLARWLLPSRRRSRRRLASSGRPYDLTSGGAE